MSLFGALEVGLKEGDLITSDEWKVLVGLRGSHDQKVKRALTHRTQVVSAFLNECVGL